VGFPSLLFVGEVKDTQEDFEMPYVNVQITKGATKEQKAELIKDITSSLVRVLHKKPEHSHIVIQKIADEDWGFEGLPTDECEIRDKNGRVIIIETSSQPPLEKARTFYRGLRYKECGRIPDSYGFHDDKITFAKSLAK
jgi:4-oxalocrotonate tautomerase